MFGLPKNSKKHQAKQEMKELQDRARLSQSPGAMIPCPSIFKDDPSQYRSAQQAAFDYEQQRIQQQRRDWELSAVQSTSQKTRDEFEDAYTGIAEAHIELLETAEGLKRIKNAAIMLVRNRKLASEEFMESERAATELTKAVSNANEKTRSTRDDYQDAYSYFKNQYGP